MRLFGLKDSPLQVWNIVFKRLLDVIVSLLVLILLSPILLLIALLVKVTSPGPVLYKQKRVGLDGRRFNIFKFRSMRLDAERDTGPVWASEDDERATAFGRFLRRNNLDELPQFLNVLRGDMSLVGPRPERPEFVKQFREEVPRYMGRHRVKSGMTGWAQINGLRGNTSIDERIKYDLYYIENWSFWLDLKIMLLTFFARENAY
ncbi:MAG: exopolysaccharide biosynthesis polyprenyl glycosylphosphotransferase [Candidatus Sumerlaeaceae bacterium]|nr:exopolysaccharide biosynthesis polyprenyl glycosylphosphotransferase [Candidatus Sumerlaeaceae bacterium]